MIWPDAEGIERLCGRAFATAKRRSVQTVAQSMGGSAGTRERRRSDAMADGKESGRWTAVTRSHAVVVMAAMSKEET